MRTITVASCRAHGPLVVHAGRAASAYWAKLLTSREGPATEVHELASALKPSTHMHTAMVVNAPGTQAMSQHHQQLDHAEGIQTSKSANHQRQILRSVGG